MPTFNPLRWGIIGTGGIASSFAKDLLRFSDHKVVAVGSRGQGKADEFAAKFGIPRAYPSYEALVADPEVDAVYVSTPHPYHCANTILALEAGKHVLVEKPFAMDAGQARRMIETARRKGLFLLEAMWTRFLPHMVEARRIIAAGTLGKIVSVMADHGQYFAPDPAHRIFARELGGGALLDLGIYPLAFAYMVLGRPSKITAVSDPAFTGVDAQTSFILQYPDGAQAILTTASIAAGPVKAAIVGTEARIEFERFFFTPSGFTVTARDGRVIQRYENGYQGHGLREEAAETARCLRAGLKESPALSLDESLSIMESMDEIRRQIGLSYG
jgi:predicted dehydrogenase